jgi:hypothetical protein
MNRIPPWMNEAHERLIKRAERSVSIGTIPLDVVEALIDALIATHENWRHKADMDRRNIAELENRIVRLGGGFDRRGMEGEPRGLMVQHGIHTVVEDSR